MSDEEIARLFLAASHEMDGLPDEMTRARQAAQVHATLAVAEELRRLVQVLRERGPRA